MKEIDKVIFGNKIPESSLTREESDIAWNAAVEGKLVIQPTLPLPMEQDLIYMVNPERRP